MMQRDTAVQTIQKSARHMRENLLKMALNAGANGLHLGGCLSATDLLAALYKVFLRISPDAPTDANRDRFILSKGHCSAAQNAALYEAGFITEAELMSFEADDGEFPTHCVACADKAIELSSGSLGNGLSFGVGTALAGRKKGRDYCTYVLLGNGECNEGTIWEAVMMAAHLGLDNLVAIVDNNGQQLDGDSSEILCMQCMPAIFTAYGWDVMEVDGNDAGAVYDVFAALPHNGKPVVVLAHTVKGRGVSFMENNPAWHHGRVSQEDYDKAMAEMEAE